MKNTLLLALICCFSFDVYSQPSKAITVIHCDPDDPDPNDNTPWPQDVSPITWNTLQQMVSYADSRNVKLTIQMTGDWVNLALNSQSRIDSVNNWQVRGHEIAAHHHLFLHTYWDGYSNISSQTNGANGAAYIDSTEVFYNQLRVLCSPQSLVTAGVGPAGSPEDTVAMEWSHGIIYQTTNKSGLTPDNGGGRFTDEAFSDVTHDILFDPLRNKNFEVCKLSYCFIENVDSVNTMMNKANNSTYAVLGGVIHPFNYSASNAPFEAWVDSIANRFLGECKSVRTVMQESSCNDLVSSSRVNESKNSRPIKIFPNPVNNKVNIHVSSDKHQHVEGSIYNISGQKIKTFYLGYMPQGNFTLNTSVDGLEKGVYLIRISKEQSTESIRLVKN